MDKPMIRGNEVRANWSLLRSDPAFDRELLGLPPEMKRYLESSDKWVPLEVDLTLHHMVYKVKGKDALLRWNYDAFMNSMRKSTLKPFVDGT